MLLLSADPEATMLTFARVSGRPYENPAQTGLTIPNWKISGTCSSMPPAPRCASRLPTRCFRHSTLLCQSVSYPLLCHPDALDFGSLLRDQKVVLISLAIHEDDVHKQERDLLGALLITQLQIATMRETAFNPVYVLHRRGASLCHDVARRGAAEAEFGVVMTTANQYLGQLTGKTLERSWATSHHDCL